MAKKKVEAATVAPPPVTDASEVTKKTRKTATAASATTPAVKTKAAAPRRKAVAKPVVEETVVPVPAEATDVESVVNLAAAGLDPREIEERAYLSWVERGCPMGSPDEDWYRAEQALLARAVGASA